MGFSEPTISHVHALTHQATINPLTQPDSFQASAVFQQVQGGLVQGGLVQGGLANADRLGDRKNNVLRGTAENDVLRGGDGNDTLRGLAGADRLYGDRGNDILRGGSGDDLLTGGSGKNLLWGEGGSDVFALSPKFGSKAIAQTSLINDFTDGQDTLQLMGVKFIDLRIRQGKGD